MLSTLLLAGCADDNLPSANIACTKICNAHGMSLFNGEISGCSSYRSDDYYKCKCEIIVSTDEFEIDEWKEYEENWQ